METYVNQHLLESIETHKIGYIHKEVDAFVAKAKEVKNKLESHYGFNMYHALRSDSIANHTAVNIKFDIDLVAPFIYDSFDTLEDMYNNVYDFLSEEYNDGTTVRKQSVSIDLTFPMDKNGYVVKLGVIPGRELSKDDYIENKYLNLYFNEDHWGFKKGSIQKINFKAQIDYISGRLEECILIRLLKIWKNTNHKDYSSFMLELFTIKAMASYSGGNDLWTKQKYVMTYIANNVMDESFRLMDPGNPNNNVLSSMDATKRNLLSVTMKNIVNEIEDDANRVAIYFPINKKYQK